MNKIFKYIFIGFVQGITEFLPVSSSGHIVLFGSLFELDNLLLLSVVAHIGTLFAVLFCYRKRIGELFCQFGRDVCCVFRRKKFEKNEKTNLYVNLIISTLITVVLFLLFNAFFEESFATSSLIWGFLISAAFLLVADFKAEGNKTINKRKAAFMGAAQGLALLPGISRSGATLVCGLMMGVEKQQALDYSFLMSIPIIIASAVWESFKLFSAQITVNWLGIFVVMLTSFVFGIMSIKIMLKLVKGNKLYFFSIYLIAISLIILFV